MNNYYKTPRNESGMPLGGIGAGKIEFCPDGRFTNVTINNNWDCPIFDGTAGTPRVPRIREGAPGSIDENAERRQSITSKEGLPGAWIAFHNPIDGALVLKTSGRPAFSCISHENIKYFGRFPIANVSYQGLRAMRLSLRAFSSFILGDTSEHYHDSSLPLALFVLQIENIMSIELDTSVAFSWQNLNGVGGYAGFPINEPDSTSPIYRQDSIGPGLWFGHTLQSGSDLRVIGDYSLRGGSDQTNSEFSWLAGWEARGHGEDVWKEFSINGRFTNQQLPYDAGALAIHLKLQPGAQAKVIFALAWYMPHLLAAETRWDHLVRPSSAPPSPLTPNRKDYGHVYSRWYKDSWEVARYGIEHWEEILTKIEKWQSWFTNSNLPSRLIDALCNDLFPLYACSWYTHDLLFAMNESPTDMNGCMGTLDQRSVGHAAIACLFPQLNKAELDLFARDQISGEEDPRHISRHYDMRTGRFDYQLDMEGAILHDVGWDHLEGGRLGDQAWLSSHWPELSSYFVLQCYLHAIWNNDHNWLEKRYPQLKAALQFQSRLDQDDDGIAELWGVGSNTYDTELYPYYGASPYIATLYLAALKVMRKLAKEKNDTDFLRWVCVHIEKASQTLEQELWNEELGYYYTWLDRNHHAWDGLPMEHGCEGTQCHISQLAGEFWANLLNLDALVERERCIRAIESIYTRNVSQVPGVPADEFNTDGTYSQGMSAYILGYFGALSTISGFPDFGWEAVKKIYHVRYCLDGSPWDAPLQWSGPGNKQAQWGRWYFSTSASWYYLWALAGIHLDHLTGFLGINPAWPTAWGKVLNKLPIFLPTFLAELTASRKNGIWSIDFKLRKLLKGPLSFKEIAIGLPGGFHGNGLIVETTGMLTGIQSTHHGNKLSWKGDFEFSKEGDGFTVFVKTR